MERIKTEKEFEVVNVKTGEVVDTLGVGDKIVHPKEANNIQYNYSKGQSFIKIYVEVNALRKELTQGEFCVAMSLADFVCYEDFILRKGGHHNGKILTTRDLAVEMDMGYDNLRKIITSLVKKNVIGVHKTGIIDGTNQPAKAITANPYIYSKGNNANKTILSLYENSKWRWKQA